MQVSKISSIEQKLKEGSYAAAYKECVKILEKQHGNAIALTMAIRAIKKLQDASQLDSLQDITQSFIADRALKKLDTMSVWPVISLANKYSMRQKYSSQNKFLDYLNKNKFQKNKKVKLLMLTCVWQRYDLTELFYSYYSDLKKEISNDIDLDVIVVGSEGELSKNLCESYGFNYVEHPNQPLSGKWQAGIEETKQYDFDALVIMGSDDFVSKDVFYTYKTAVERNTLFFGFQDLYLYDVKSETAGYWKGYGSASGGLAQPERVGETIGLGRLLLRPLIQFLDYNIWKGLQANKSLDGLMKRRIVKETGMSPVTWDDKLQLIVNNDEFNFGLVAAKFKDHGSLGLDVKHSQNVTAFEKYNVSNESYDVLKPEFFKSFKMYDKLQLLNQKGLTNKSKIKVAIGIPSFNRKEMLNDLLRDIFSNAENDNIEAFVFVYDDASTIPVELESDLLKYEKFVEIYRAENNGGKKLYWRTVNFILDKISKKNADYYYYLPDDVKLEKGFFKKSLHYWNAIDDDKKISLNLLEDGREQCWTGYQREIVKFKGTRVFKSQWLDMAIVFDSTLLRYRLKEIPLSTWDNKPLQSSGVGAQLSKRFKSSGFNMYQVIRSLVLHGEHQSQMNYEERLANPLLSTKKWESHYSYKYAFKKYNSKKIVAGVAVIKSRMESLEQTVESIINQVDKLYVYQNGFYEPAEFLDDPKIELISSVETGIDRGDAGKFYMLGHDKNCLYFSIDDDLYYPPDYVARTLSYLSTLEQPAIVSYHGRVLDSDASCYYTNIAQNYKCLEEVKHLERVEFAGTGVMAFDTEFVKVGYDAFESENMADIWMGVYALNNKIPLFVLPHPRNWIDHNEIDFSETIFVRYKSNTERTNAVLRERFWNLEN
ncbi:MULTISPECIES: glycosyltransferase family A protein [unclassified Halomonas]|uniref:glycosyltransferase family 2 protein n=1 Tax=unclassified Halomonas TaxID=2609666 RepID=UPI001EF737D0|nr:MULTISPECIES: glycosyltransferase family A protein [unclassified Halomonas]MCG7591991.1 glycosyltransferase family 2 protein [Halomonas sp. McD50-5]MCG7617922.1 glycosyltransferase family 2 protein [Halomonas sp. McD50-4]